MSTQNYTWRAGCWDCRVPVSWASAWKLGMVHINGVPARRLSIIHHKKKKVTWSDPSLQAVKELRSPGNGPPLLTPHRTPLVLSWWVFLGIVGEIDCKGEGVASVPSNGPDVNNLNRLWKHTRMDMCCCCCWKKHYSEVMETKQHLNPCGDQNREKDRHKENAVTEYGMTEKVNLVRAGIDK